MQFILFWMKTEKCKCPAWNEVGIIQSSEDSRYEKVRRIRDHEELKRGFLWFDREQEWSEKGSDHESFEKNTSIHDGLLF